MPRHNVLTAIPASKVARQNCRVCPIGAGANGSAPDDLGSGRFARSKTTEWDPVGSLTGQNF